MTSASADSNRDLPTERANAHTSVKSASTAVLRVAPMPDTSLPTAANGHSSVMSSSSSVMKAIFSAKKLSANSSQACEPSKECYLTVSHSSKSSIHCTAFEGDAKVLTILATLKVKVNCNSIVRN